MTRDTGRVRCLPAFVLLVLGLAAGGPSAAHAQTEETLRDFRHIPVWVQPGAWQDSTLLSPQRCGGLFRGPLADSLRTQSRTLTVRFLRNRRVEARPDFGGYRVYRVIGTPNPSERDTMLLRRYSLNPGDWPLWHFSKVNPTTLEFECSGVLAYDSVATFVDPDSSGSFERVCREVDEFGHCLSPGDSVWVLVAPPGPHDGFRVWYSVTYEAKNTLDNNYAELFVPDTTDDWSLCGTVGVPSTCPNLNDLLANMTDEPVKPTGGPTENLLAVAVVPNPFRESARWDLPDGNEVHFVKLPRQARIRIYTVAGDLVRELTHDSPTDDSEPWDLKNAGGEDVASGIYMYRVEAGPLAVQNRFIIIR